ncbi:MAG: S9 family peptidase [Bacteroidetes bacterium]|nr:S9 family peptidase [Bacteroidota bacterium]
MNHKIKMLFIAFLLVIGGFSTAQETKKMTLADVWMSPTFFPKYWQDITPLADGKHFLALENIFLEEYDFTSGKKTATWLKTSELKLDGKKLGIDEFELSPDEKKILFCDESDQIYRHSFKAFYYVYDRETKQVAPVSKNGKQQLAELSPVNNNQVCFVRDNNIFLSDLAAGTEKQITTDGKRNFILNGLPDWVYEEEFGFAKAWEWSPDGKKIAWIRFDESAVKEYSLTEYGELYPEQYVYKYPKAGEDNSIVSVWIYDLESGKAIQVDIGTETDIYIPRIKWTKDPNILSVTRLNRLQNKLEMLFADASTGKTNVFYTDENKSYIAESAYETEFLEGNKFIKFSERKGYDHLYLYSGDGKHLNAITSGNFEVTELIGIDEKNGVVYYVSTEGSPMTRDVYSVKLDGTRKTKISVEKGTNEAVFSSDYKYYVLKYNSANTPLKVSLWKNGGKEITVLEDNATVAENMKAYGFSPVEFFTFQTSEGVDLSAYRILPPNMDKTKKYPVLMYQYSGPGSQEVADAWGGPNYVWHQFLAQQGYVIVCVDGRGTGFRGEEFRKCTYMQLGKFETIDQIESAKYLATLPFVDKDRIGIWGWSYGGYMAALCMTKGADVFKTGISVAPVTNWRQYDNIYTERFMRKPQDNAAGYDDNSPINFVKKMKGKYLIVHGTADDNVHPQNSWEFILALVNANKEFEMQMYPNKNHGIYGGYTRYHLFNRLTNYILENL